MKISPTPKLGRFHAKVVRHRAHVTNEDTKHEGDGEDVRENQENNACYCRPSAAYYNKYHNASV